jgi:arylsulfatase A-like enzyme
VKGGRTIEDFIGFCDLAPTFLDAAGLRPTPDMTGRSFLDILTGDQSGRLDPKRDHVVVGRERHHGGARPGVLGYPARSIRTYEYRYIHNFAPDRWPAGDPPRYMDCDDGPAKSYMTAHRDDERVKPLFDLAFGKRPAEELYDLSKDPDELKNVADAPPYADAKARLAAELDQYLRETRDPRAVGGGEVFDQYPYRGGPGAAKK